MRKKKSKIDLFSNEDVENLRKVVHDRVNEIVLDAASILFEGTRKLAKEGLQEFFDKRKKRNGGKKEEAHK